MPRIAFIGAGSMVFAKTLISDILSFSEFSNAELVLMDIDAHRLEQTKKIADTMVENEDLDATIEETTDRGKALEGADYVINMINVGGTEPFENEIRIPEKYGVEQSIGDTTGPGGIFRALRTIPTLLDIADDMEDLCSDAVFLNYTNPMAILCKTMFDATDIETIGLCHSVPHTAKVLADYVGVPENELNYWVAGINHMAWFLEATHNGESIYPTLYEVMTDEKTYERDTVRFQMLKHFGLFPTESSHHMSEYLPYFRTSPELIKEFTGTDYAERMPTATYLEGWKSRSEDRDSPILDIDLDDVSVERSEEYASRIIHSLETNTPRRFNLNVSNETGAIKNLPSDACVEVPTFVDGSGIHPSSVGELPTELAAFDRQHSAIYELVVEGALENDRMKIHQAVKLDPLTGAMLTLDEIHEMVEELIDANEAYLPDLEWQSEESRMSHIASLKTDS